MVPGWTDLVKELHYKTRSDYILWHNLGKPRLGPSCKEMRCSRLSFKYALRQCRVHEEQIKADKLVYDLTNKDSMSFWRAVSHTSKLNTPLSKISKINEKGIWVSTTVIENSINKLKLGKSSGHDGLRTEYFKFADHSIYFYLSILFTSIISHGYIPDGFMKTVLLPIIKSKTGEMHNVNNYCSIALVTSCSKLFELILLDSINVYLQTTNNQFGFKSIHATDMCIFTLKNVINYYRRLDSPVYTCFLDASKPFDHVNHWTLLTPNYN